MHPEHSYPSSAQLDSLVRQMQKDGIPFSDAVREFRNQFVLTVLRDLNWNETKAAPVLGIHRNTLARTVESWIRTSVRWAEPSAARHRALLPRSTRESWAEQSPVMRLRPELHAPRPHHPAE
jgi:transcriptional regulator of acetoin/glycerol metabolism